MEGTESFPTRMRTTYSSPVPFPLFHPPKLQDTDRQETTQPEGDLLRELALRCAIVGRVFDYERRSNFACIEDYYRIRSRGMPEAKALSPKLARQTCYDRRIANRVSIR